MKWKNDEVDRVWKEQCLAFSASSSLTSTPLGDRPSLGAKPGPNECFRGYFPNDN